MLTKMIIITRLKQLIENLINPARLIKVKCRMFVEFAVHRQFAVAASIVKKLGAVGAATCLNLVFLLFGISDI